MIIFLHDASHCYTHEGLNQQKQLPEIRSYSYDWLLKQRKIPAATYIFTDRERMDNWLVRVLSQYYNQINDMGDGFRAINNPAQMCNRRMLLRSLFSEGINPFNAYAVSERVMPQRYPVFVRNEFDHHYPVTPLLENEQQLKAALDKLRSEGHADDGLLIIEYCGEPFAGKLYRKLSSYRVGSEVFFYNTVHEENWLVKYGTVNAATDQQYLQEQSFIKGNAFQTELKRIFDVAGIEYGRADFGLVDGKVVLYEINTNPTTRAPAEEKQHPNAIRQNNIEQGWQLYSDALQKLDSGVSSRIAVKLEKASGVKRRITPSLLQAWITR